LTTKKYSQKGGTAKSLPGKRKRVPKAGLKRNGRENLGPKKINGGMRTRFPRAEIRKKKEIKE